MVMEYPLKPYETIDDRELESIAEFYNKTPEKVTDGEIEAYNRYREAEEEDNYDR